MNSVMLSFDVEEFDFPRERGEAFSLEEGIKVSKSGLDKVLKLLSEKGVRATFFCTGNFALAEAKLLQEMAKEGHEIACHGVDHFEVKETDAVESKQIVEKAVKVKVVGYRQPRMQKIDYGQLFSCGYRYDSSVNPAFIPGRYNNLKVSVKPFYRQKILEIPVSVATNLRMPMFWLALHLYPRRMYIEFAKRIVRKNGYFATYFHPWEFAEISKFKIVPWYIKKNSGDRLIRRLGDLIDALKKENYGFITYKEFYENKKK